MIATPRRFVLCIALYALTACSSGPNVIGAFDVQPRVNPDARGRPSPVTVRFYELKSLAAFNGADFFSLFERDKETLGSDLVEREEFQLLPGEKREFERRLQADTRYIAVVAAFRNLERSRWRANLPVNSRWRMPIAIRIEEASIGMSGR